MGKAQREYGDKTLIGANKGTMWNGEENPDLSAYTTDPGFYLTTVDFEDKTLIISEEVKLGGESGSETSDSEVIE